MPPEKFKLPVFKGLRPRDELLYNLEYLEASENLYFNENGIFEAEKFERTEFGLDEHAQVFVTRVGVFVILLAVDPDDEDYLYSWSGSSLTLLLSTPGAYSNYTKLWSCADFGNYVLFSNGNSIWVRNISTGAFTEVNTTFPLSRWICAHRGRLILASPVTTTFGITVGNEPKNLVAWSTIGNLRFQINPSEVTGSDSNIYTCIKDHTSVAGMGGDRPVTGENFANFWALLGSTGGTWVAGTAYKSVDETNMAGYMPLEYSGNLLRVEPLKEHVIVYGDGGISALTLAGKAGYAMTTIHTTGIKDMGAVCVNGIQDGITAHYFIDKTGDLYIVDASLQVTKLGYKEFFNAESILDVVLTRMSYNIRRNELLISFGYFVTYIFGSNGLSSVVEANIESLVEKEGTRYIHAPEAIAQTNTYLMTNTFDMGTACQKYLWGFSANVTCPEEVSVTIYSRKTRTGEWTTSTKKNFDKATGYFNAGRIIGVEFKIEMIVASYTTFQLNNIEIQYSKINGGMGG